MYFKIPIVISNPLDIGFFSTQDPTMLEFYEKNEKEIAMARVKSYILSEQTNPYWLQGAYTRI